MNDSEFYKTYKDELLLFINDTISKLESLKELPYNQLNERSIDFGAEVNYKANILVSEIMLKNNIDLDKRVLQKGVVVKLNNYLYLGCFSIINECKKYYSEKVDAIIKEVRLRDFPLDID